MGLDSFLGDLEEEDISNFRPGPYYNKWGDCIECYFSNERYFAHRLDSLLTLYISFKTKKIIGFKLKEIKRITSEGENIDLIVCEKDKNRIDITLMIWIVFRQNTEIDPEVVRGYNNLIGTIPEDPDKKTLLKEELLAAFSDS